MKASAYIDGASLSNPGYAGLAVLLFDAEGRLLLSLCEPIGKQTNNFAEYYALLRCLHEAVRLGISHLDIYTDSELIAKQWTGEYKVQSENLKPLYWEAKELAQRIGTVVVHHTKAQSDEWIKLVDKMSQRAAEHIQKFSPELFAE